MSFEPPPTSRDHQQMAFSTLAHDIAEGTLSEITASTKEKLLRDVDNLSRLIEKIEPAA